MNACRSCEDDCAEGLGIVSAAAAVNASCATIGLSILVGVEMVDRFSGDEGVGGGACRCCSAVSTCCCAAAVSAATGDRLSLGRNGTVRDDSATVGETPVILGEGGFNSNRMLARCDSCFAPPTASGDSAPLGCAAGS